MAHLLHALSSSRRQPCANCPQLSRSCSQDVVTCGFYSHPGLRSISLMRHAEIPEKGEDSLWVVPSWAAAPPPPAIPVIMEPGVAFGTGEHPTTRLCLAWLWENRAVLRVRRAA